MENEINQQNQSTINQNQSTKSINKITIKPALVITSIKLQ
jgi:hypothetical protein